MISKYPYRIDGFYITGEWMRLAQHVRQRIASLVVKERVERFIRIESLPGEQSQLIGVNDGK